MICVGQNVAELQIVEKTRGSVLLLSAPVVGQPRVAQVAGAEAAALPALVLVAFPLLRNLYPAARLLERAV